MVEMMEEYIVGFILFFVITGIWSLIIIHMLKKHGSKKANLKGIAFLFTLLIIMGVFILAAWALIDYHKEPEFCGLTCHPMVPYYESYMNPLNNSIMNTHVENDIKCVDCHTGEGLIGQIKAVTVDGTYDLVHLILDDYDPDNLHGYVPSENCLKGCHDGLDWKLEAPMPRGSAHITADDGTTIWPIQLIWHPYTNNGTDFSELESRDTCVDCHDQRMNGIGFTRFACPICHDLDENMLNIHRDQTCGMGDCHEEPEFIGHRQVMDNCMFCHDRLHPSDARVPYKIAQEHGIYKVNSTFCSPCHQETYDKFINSDSRHGWDMGCPECHEEHKYWPECSDCHDENNIPHNSTAKYENCMDCHENGAHDSLDITLQTTTYTIPNDFCSDCHAGSITSLSQGSHKTHRCTSCHGEHGEISVNFEDYCNGCHNGIPDFHDETIDGCACHGDDINSIHFIPADTGPEPEPDYTDCTLCHSDAIARLDNGEHSSQDCQNCHPVHATISVDFSNCQGCHPIIPSTPIHDETTDNCQNCHDTTKIHVP